MHNHSYENGFNLHANEISFSYERMSTKTRFEKEAKGDSEMAYYGQTPKPDREAKKKDLGNRNLARKLWVLSKKFCTVDTENQEFCCMLHCA